MNIVFLTSQSPHHYFLINEINKLYPVKKVFFQAHDQGSDPSVGNKIKRVFQLKSFSLFMNRYVKSFLFGAERKLEERFEKRLFFGNGEPALNLAIPSEKVIGFNVPEVVEKVENEEPDLIVVFGTEILKGEILKIARKGILNIHRGILPQYRGGGIPNWCFYNKDFDNIGATIHVCTENLDGGDIVGQKFYKLQRGDKFYTVRARTTVLAVEILEEVIGRYKNGVVEYHKQACSKVWSAKGLSLIKEIKARANFYRYVKNKTVC